MPATDYFKAAGDLFGGFGSYFASSAEAKGDKAAAGYYAKAAEITGEQTAIKELQVQRAVYQTQSSAEAAAGANGVLAGGSAGDILRSNAQQGALSRTLVAEQGQIQEGAYLGQAAAANAAASSAKSKGKGGLFGGIVGAVGKVAPLVL